MKQITIRIPNDQLDFFKELIEKLGIEIEEEVSIPESHKELVRLRMEKSKPEDLQTWESVRRNLSFKH